MMYEYMTIEEIVATMPDDEWNDLMIEINIDRWATDEEN